MLSRLTKCYLEPHRYYHNLSHITDMLLKSRDLNLSFRQVYAIWYHDVIYNPERTDNEERSASLAFSELYDILWGSDATIVEKIILDTKAHIPTIEESAIVLDLDMSILADPLPKFKEYVYNIRKEYSFLDNEAWSKGRLNWINKILNKDRIFYTSWGKELEAKARENLLIEKEYYSG